MSSLPGIIGLLVFMYARPHEFFVELKDYNFLYLFLGASAIGILHDVSERRTKIMMPPLTRYVILFSVWCVLTLVVRKPDQLTGKGILVLVCALLYGLLAHGVQRISGFYRVITAIFALGLFVSYVGADQGLSGYQCVIYNPAEKNSRAWPDGRDCFMNEPDGSMHDGTLDCIAGGKPGVAYLCEHAGLFGTTSCGGGRVRYLGVLLDPNELALATALATPFAFALFEIRATVMRLALLLFSLVIIAVEIVFTQSRGGQVTFGAVLGVYFVRKYGIKRGAMVGAALAIPMVAMGGRSDEAATASTMERLNCAAEGIKMLMAYPVTGVGYLQFTDHHFLTAHNAYILAIGELGLPGMWLFGIIIYLAVKIPLSVVMFQIPPIPVTRANIVAAQEARVIKALGTAMLAAMVGACIGIYFLSWTYHYVLWIHFGLCGALHSTMTRAYPTYSCELSWKEARLVFAAYLGYVILWSGFIVYKGAWSL
jgi:hypothetical protein